VVQPSHTWATKPAQTSDAYLSQVAAANGLSLATSARLLALHSNMKLVPSLGLRAFGSLAEVKLAGLDRGRVRLEVPAGSYEFSAPQ
jgi:hypothetical protein